MKTGLLARLLTTALLLAPCGSAWSQSNGTAAVQMRPDEAFWNAIRDGSKREQFELFLQVHPESPYAAEARRKIDALPAERQPAVAAEPIRPAAKPQPTLDATPATSPEPKTANPQNGSAAALSTLGALVHRSSLAKLGFILTEQG
ncbi:MAG: hypothetical protein Q8Q62_08875, partial [Mesorhizobium sp.]|nr:hypothetical protein [Mesorhizobium sp.]